MELFVKKNLSVIVAVCLCVNFSGCATIISGEDQNVAIRSNPSGAHVRIDGLIEGTTPMMVDLARKKRHQIDVEHGGQKVTRGTTRGFNWWYLGNIIFGGVVGLIIDPCMGGMYEIKPETVYVDFNSANPSAEVPAPAAPAAA